MGAGAVGRHGHSVQHPVGVVLRFAFVAVTTQNLSTMELTAQN